MKKYLENEITHLNSPNINVCFTAHIDRAFSENEADFAVRLLVKRHPSLIYTVKTDENGQKYYDNDGNIETHILPEADLLDLYIKIDSEPFDFHKSLVKLYILNGENSCDIMLIGHHIIADGIGYLNLLRDIFSALDGKLSAEVCAVPENNSIANSKPGFLLSLFANGLNKKWQKQGKIFTNEEYYDFFTKYRSQYVPQVMLRQLEGGFILRLREACKRWSGSVNEAICLAFAYAIFKTQKRDALRIGVAASIRNEMVIPTQNTLGNFTTGISATILNAGEAAGKVRRQLSNPRTKYQVVHLLSKLTRPLIESAMYAAYGNYDSQASRQLAETLGERRDNKAVGFSNLGAQKFDGYTFNVSDVQFIGPAFPQNFLTVGVMTVGDTLKFCLRYNTPETSETEIADIYDKAVLSLQKMAK